MQFVQGFILHPIAVTGSMQLRFFFLEWENIVKQCL